ncbi:MAG: dihydropteroate synthase [Cytophagales bacterium]|nr:dihydropteroate synthase [Cytophagales bacterium]
MVSPRSDIGTTALTLNVRGQLVDLSQPAVMGILNVTPDSFYAGSRVAHLDEVVRRAGEMLRQGATFLDVGGYSTRPGAEDISPEAELERVVPAVEAVRKAFPDALVSVDTFRAAVARAAVAAGAGLVNDISGGTLDAEMFPTVAALQIPYVLMHLRGTPQTMTSYTQYEDLPREIFGYFVRKVFALRQLGVKDIVLDLGFGFAKTPDQNFQLLRHWDYFKPLGLPVLAGLSRKSMIYKKLGIPVAEALNGTTVLNTIALTQGAAILRVHDVKEAAEAVKLYRLYRGF